MNKNRLEAFSDAVIAILITIMVLEFKIPKGETYKTLLPVVPKFLSYILSYIYLGIYWSNHHHLMHTVKNVTGKIMWANLYLLFWLSLIPFATAWNGENDFANFSMEVYGFILLMNAVAYYNLQRIIIKSHGENSILGKVIGKDLKGKSSGFLYFIGICLSYFNPIFGGLIYILVALMWLIPDKRIEGIFDEDKN